MEDKVGPYRGL